MSDFVELLKRSVRWRYHLIPLPLAYGAEYRKWFAFLEQSQRFDEERLQEYTWRRLKALIEFAYNNTSYYRKSFEDVGCEPGDVKTLADYAQLPTTNRRLVRENLDAMTPINFAATQPITTLTSGTTGYPLKLYRSRSQEELRKAIVWRHYHDLGYRYKERRVTLGRPLDFPDKQQYFSHDVLENNLQLNSFHLNPRDFRMLYDAALRFAPKMLVGHPAALYTFCLQTEKLRLRPLKVAIVYSNSEKLYPHHIAKFEEHFGAKVYDYFGNRENSLAVTQFSCGGMHINPEFGLVEFVKDGRQCKIGEAGSIITTPLENYSTPLLRYDTGDVGKPLGRCSECGRAHPTMEIMGGRGKDLLLTREGFVNCHLDTYLTRHKFKGADYIQVVQQQIDRVTVRIFPSSEFRGTEDSARLKQLAHDCLGGFFEVEVEILSEPPFTEAGKMPYVVSELARDEQGLERS